MISIPFRGSKRYSYRQIRPIVEENGYKRVMEPFGGTGVLTANLLNDGLIDEGVINDYDRMFDLYPAYLDIKDAVVEECKQKGLVKTFHGRAGESFYYDENGERVYIESETLSGEHREILQKVIGRYDPKYYQLLATGACFCHSAKQNNPNGAVLSDFYYFRRMLDTKEARRYLEVIDRCRLTHCDYKEFLATQSFDENTLLIIDPPYVDANVGTYKNGDIFDYDRTSELIGLVKKLGVDFVFFNYGMEQIKQLLSEHGLEPTLIEYTGTASKTADRKSRDVLAYIKRTNDTTLRDGCHF